MRFAILALLFTLLAHTASAQSQPKALDYKTAYGLSQSGDKPMLVLVTATWCAPCQQMKASTLPSLWAKNAFKNVHFAIVDYDAETEVAQSMIGDRGVPQLILFQKSNGKWTRHYIAGMQTVEGVEAFLAKANHVQIADARDNADAANGIIEKK